MELTDGKVLEHARLSLQAHLPLSAEGYSRTTEDLIHALLGAAAQGSTIELVCG